jgi:hypothetical protein
MPPFYIIKEILWTNLRILKLVTGEEVVGEVAEEKENSLRMENPCVLGIAMTESGKASCKCNHCFCSRSRKW